MRARWSLLVTGNLVTFKEVDLKNKPKNLIRISPKGTVPVLITNSGEVIEESIDIMKWCLCKSDPNDILRTNNHIEERELYKIIEENDITFKYHLDRFKYHSRDQTIDPSLEKLRALQILVSWNNKIKCNSTYRQGGWLIGNKQSLADWAIWPFVRQFRIVNKEDFDKEYKLKELKEWLKEFTENELFKQLMKKRK